MQHVLLLAAAPWLIANAGETSGGESLVFNTQVALQVDGRGTVTHAAADPKLSAALRARIEQVAQSWRFAPVVHGGKPVAGTTYAQIGVCALPQDGAVEVALAFRGNGPGEVPRSRRDTAMPFPKEALRAGKDIAFKLHYRVQPDGTADIVSIQYSRSPGASLEPGIERAWRQWLQHIDFQPELLDGKPVATVVESEVEYQVSSLQLERDPRRLARQERQSLPECLAASGKEPAANAALDSPFKKLPGS